MPGIYLDHAATTPVRPEVREAMLPYLKEQYGNPSGLYQLAVEAEEAMEAARKTIAATLGCETEEIYFTSGGTESDNWAIKSAVEAAKKEKTLAPAAAGAAISSPHRSSITQCCIPAGRWKKKAVR